MAIVANDDYMIIDSLIPFAIRVSLQPHMYSREATMFSRATCGPFY